MKELPVQSIIFLGVVTLALVGTFIWMVMEESKDTTITTSAGYAKAESTIVFSIAESETGQNTQTGGSHE